MQSAALYNDFGTLAELRTEARRDADASLKDVAAQFEAIFVQMMLKSMRDATIEGGLFESNQLETYEQMYDQQLSLELSNRGGIGLADTIVEQMSKTAGRKVESSGGPMPLDGAGKEPALPLDAYRERSLPFGGGAALRYGPMLEGASVQPLRPARKAAAPELTVKSPADFVETYRPLAERAAQRLGVEPKVLLAQAALETGWGQHMTTGRDGSSNNLFNIKAGREWQGATVNVGTVEYRGDVAVRESAEFRAYESAARSFDDYVEFIESNPRYRQALEQAGDGETYLRELQAAGYATDPAYADKILAIMERAELRATGQG